MSHSGNLALMIAVQSAVFGATAAAYLGMLAGEHDGFDTLDAGAMGTFGVLLGTLAATYPPFPQLVLGGAASAGFTLGAAATGAAVLVRAPATLPRPRGTADSSHAPLGDDE